MSRMTTKKGVAVGAIGLNAAAIIFLYSHFVPRTEYNALQKSHVALQKECVELREKVAEMKGAQDYMWGPVNPKSHPGVPSSKP